MVLLGNGDGTFKQPISSASAYPKSLAAGDFKRGRRLDLALVESDTTPSGGTFRRRFSIGNGDGSFQNPVTYSSSPGSTSLAVTDLNGDGWPDIVTNTSALLNKGDGTFGPALPVCYTGGGLAFSGQDVAVEDFNGDGYPDIVTLGETAPHGAYGSSVAVCFGNGDGTFSAVTYYPGYNLPTGVVAADLNGDRQTRYCLSRLMAPAWFC